MPSEEFAEERGIRKIQRISYLLNRHIRAFQLRFGIDNDDIGYGIQHAFSRHLLDGGAQMLKRDSQLIGIELCTALILVVFSN